MADLPIWDVTRGVRTPGVDYPIPDPVRQGLSAFVAMASVNRQRQALEQKFQEFQIREALMAQQHLFATENQNRKYDLAVREFNARETERNLHDILQQGRLEDQQKRTQNIIDNDALLERNREAERTLREERFQKDLRTQFEQIHKI